MMKLFSVITIVVVIVLSFFVFIVAPAINTASPSSSNDIIQPAYEVNDNDDAFGSDSKQITQSEPSSPLSNVDAAEIGLDTNPELLAEIEREMQFTEAPEGDVSYMSPEAETPQQLDVAFPGVAPDPHITMPGNIAPEDSNMLEDMGKPLEKNTKMDDLPLN
ncbi:hypothetical protein KUL118_59040 [Tenacibaculum sp. KUL118]|nr:hypothetical protein KUL118_59040 [Tenacibaculum sp. KUL118]